MDLVGCKVTKLTLVVIGGDIGELFFPFWGFQEISLTLTKLVLLYVMFFWCVLMIFNDFEYCDFMFNTSFLLICDLKIFAQDCLFQMSFMY